MSNDWWPALLAHIPREKPWGEKYVVIAEIKSFKEKPHAGQRRTFSALVPLGQVEEVKKNLAGLGSDVSTSGPHPSPRPGTPYEPKFWIEAKGLPSRQYEPLILSWSSHDKSVLLPDPKFLMTYGLSPRTVGDGWVHWDDPSAPLHDVVKVSAPSIWDFPTATHATVSVMRDYLQDYLTLRNMALVEVFWEIRWGRTDDAIERRLGDQEALDIRFTDRLFQLNRYLEDRNFVAAQVWGGRLVALPGELPISENTLESEGLIWPGFPEPITDGMAERMSMSDRVYVDDAVLGAYEGRPGFRVYPKSGSVTFGTQWSVGFCERVGRNLIRLELKKLYEGVPPHVTRYWNRFAVEPLPSAAYPAALEARNIATRAKDVTFAIVALGETLAALAKSVGVMDLPPEDFVGLRRRALEYHGWWTFDETNAIARHVSLNIPVDNFLDRCMSLEKLIVEGLSEASLRKLLVAIGVPDSEIAKFGSLKLLDCIVRMAQVAHKTGLNFKKNDPLIWDRLKKEGTIPTQPIIRLFALHDMRVLKAHKTGDRDKTLAEELKRFGIAFGEGAAGYGKVLDQIYDSLLAELREANARIDAAR